MAIQFGTALRNARLDVIESTIGTAPLLYIYDLTAGAPANSLGSYALIRIVACGQTNEHMPHWRHNSGCQIGILTAILRFSNWVVPTG